MTDTEVCPNSVRKLDNALRRMAGNEKAYVNIRSMVANAIVCQLMPGSVIKGGSSLKIRFGDAQTRFTTDLDTARRVSAERFVSELESSLAEGWNGFTGRLVEGRQAHPKNVPTQYIMQPFEVKLSYIGKPWCTVVLEVGHDEIGDADEFDLVEPIEANRYLSNLGFPKLDPVALMPLHYQIAQKLHGLSTPGGDRAHDAIDLQILISNSEIDWALTKRTCLRLFAYRKLQEWPPTITASEGWETIYAAQSEGLQVKSNITEAVMWCNELIARIDAVAL